MAGSIFHIYSNGEDILQALLKQVRAERRVIPIPEKAFMQEVHKGTYFPVSGEIVPIYSKNKMTGMAICCRNISEGDVSKLRHISFFIFKCFFSLCDSFFH